MNLIEINARNEKLITCDGVGKEEKRRILAAIMAEAFAEGQENTLYAQECERGADDSAKEKLTDGGHKTL